MIPPELYARHRAKAEALLARYGASVSLIRVSRSGPNYSPQTTSTAISVRWLDTGSALEERDGALIPAGTRIGLLGTLPALGVVPTTADRLRLGDGGADYQIRKVEPASPATDRDFGLYEVEAVR